MYKEHHISLSPHSLILFTTKTTGCLVLLQLEASHSACAVSLYQQSPVVTITCTHTRSGKGCSQHRSIPNFDILKQHDNRQAKCGQNSTNIGKLCSSWMPTFGLGTSLGQREHKPKKVNRRQHYNFLNTRQALKNDAVDLKSIE